MAKSIYQSHLKMKLECLQHIEQNVTILQSTILAQCALASQEELSEDPAYLSKSVTFDSVWLLQTLQKITAGVNKTTNKHHSAFKATKAFYLTQQLFTESLDDYYNRFDSAKELVELFDAGVIDVELLHKVEL